jgi:hypothetical protein
MPQPPFPHFIRCPKCEKVLRLEQHQPVSPLHRAVGWTDGDGLGWPVRGSHDELYACVRCGEFLWRSEHPRLPPFKHIGSHTPFVGNDRSKLERALASDRAIGEHRSLWIRLRMWWCDNDPLRVLLHPRSEAIQIVSASVKIGRKFAQNADVLLTYLNPDDPRELLLMGELFRQLGRFEEATRLLKNTAEVFFQLQEKEVAEARAYNEQFESDEESKVQVDLNPRVESLILLARFIAERALEGDPLVRPLVPKKAVFPLRSTA